MTRFLFQRCQPMLLVILLVSCQAAYIPSRAFLHRHESAPPGLGAYGYLILTKRPADDKRARYDLVCGSYLRNLEPLGDYRDRDSKTLMVTFWLLGTSVRSHNCQQLIDHYDYAAATVIASSIGKLDVEGPILVAWEAPFPPNSPSPNALVLDMSRFVDADLDRAFGIWKDQISRNPATWQDGFNLLLAREAFRNLVQKYGQQIVDVVKGVFV